jgi:hypothetical protein
MKRTWTFRVLFALIAAAPAMPAVHAAPEPQTTDDTLKQILSQLQDVNKKLNAIQANQDLQIQSMQEDITRLKADVARLNDEVKRLSNTTTNVAASINPAAPTAPGLTTMGNIILDNRYPVAATVVLNGQSYRLMPFERVSVAAPVGRFRYAVYTDDFGQVQALSDRILVAGRDFPITIHP